MAKYYPELDRMFSALGDPTRRAIVARLARGEASVSELAAPHRMALPSFLGHLKKLEAAGLVASSKEGRTRICRLRNDALVPAQDWLSEQQSCWERRLDAFEDYAIQLNRKRSHGTRPQD